MSAMRLTRDEEKILRSFYRRHAMPYVVATASVAIIAMIVTLAGGEAPDAAAEAARSEAASLLKLRGEVQQLLGELEEVRRQTQSELTVAEERMGGLGKQAAKAPAPEKAAPSAEVASLKKRIDAAIRRLDKAESRIADLAKAPARTASAAPPSGAAAWDVSSILDRLYSTETRLDKLDAGRNDASGSAGGASGELASRLGSLEAAQRRGASERAEVEKSVLNRLYKLETRFEELESVAAARPGSTAPAAAAR